MQHIEVDAKTFEQFIATGVTVTRQFWNVMSPIGNMVRVTDGDGYGTTPHKPYHFTEAQVAAAKSFNDEGMGNDFILKRAALEPCCFDQDGNKCFWVDGEWKKA